MVNMNPNQQQQPDYTFAIPSGANGGGGGGDYQYSHSQRYYQTTNNSTATTAQYPTTTTTNSQYSAHHEEPHRRSSGESTVSSVMYGTPSTDLSSPASSSDLYYPSPASIHHHVSPTADAVRFPQPPQQNGTTTTTTPTSAAGYPFPQQQQFNYEPPAAAAAYYHQQQQQQQPSPPRHQQQQPAIFTRGPSSYQNGGGGALGLSTTPTNGNHTATSQQQQSRKRQKPATGAGDDESDDEDHYRQDRARLPGACARCKGLKVKCDFPPDAEACKKCMQTGNECYIPGRKKRKPPAKRDELIKAIHDKDSLIVQLLEQLEARSSILAPLSLPAESASSSVVSDPTAQAALHAAEEKREREIAEWIKKARATIEQTKDGLGFGLIGGTANPVVGDAEGGQGDGAESDDDDVDEEDDDGTEEDVSRKGSGSRRGSAGKGSALPTAAPLGFIEHMGRGLHKRKGSVDEENLGVSNPRFFSQSSKAFLTEDSDQFQLPQILQRGIITPKEVNELFKTYFDYMNLSTCLLDERLYTPEKTVYRSPFLFTVICAIASRYHPQRKDLYPILMNHARLAAGTALISGRKSLEACQAYILMAIYPIPARRWSEDRSWMFLGCAIRMATDLNLHHPPVLNNGKTATTIDTIMELEGQSREILNRTRAWLSCFNIDKATSTQFGKPTTLREDWMFPLLQRNMTAGGSDWWCPSPFANKFDIHLCAYSALLREIASFHEKIYSDPTNPTGLNESINFEEVTFKFDDEIEKMGEEWFHRVDTHMDRQDPQCVFRKGLLQLEFYYNQLVALSFGFQHAFRRGVIQRDNTFLLRCYAASSRVVRIVVDELAPQKYMRYCPESPFIFATFASAFLLKLLRPKFIGALDGHQQTAILSLVERLVNSLSEVAMDDRHAPKLYSRFLSGLLKKAHKILARGTSSVSSPASSAANADSPKTAPDVNKVVQTSGLDGPPGVGDGQSYSMEGVQSALPVNVWPYGITSAGDGDTLASMQFFGDQFWEEGLLPGFAWSGTGPTHAGDNIIQDPGLLEQELHVPLPSFSNPNAWAVPNVMS